MQLNLHATSEEIDKAINAELERTETLHQPRFRSPAEALGALREEYKEVEWEFFKMKSMQPEQNTSAYGELIQLGAMVKKSILSVCVYEKDRPKGDG